MNFDNARNNMVSQQVRSWDVINKKVLNAMLNIPREEFVQPEQRKLAFADTALPIGHNEHMMKPVVEGRMLQALNLQPNERVLEVGTGSGYVTALLAKLTNHVTSIDQHSQFIDTAENRLVEIGVHNTTLQTADFFEYKPASLFDAIIITGALEKLPNNVFNWINPEGRIFAIIGNSPIMEARIYNKDKQFHSHFDTCIPKLNRSTKLSFVL